MESKTSSLAREFIESLIMTKRKSKKPIVAEYIEWGDHVSLAEAGWKDHKDAHELTPAICKSVGFLIRETATDLTIVGSIADEQVDGEILIIKNCIIKRVRIWPQEVKNESRRAKKA